MAAGDELAEQVPRKVGASCPGTSQGSSPPPPRLPQGHEPGQPQRRGPAGGPVHYRVQPFEVRGVEGPGEARQRCRAVLAAHQGTEHVVGHLVGVVMREAELQLPTLRPLLVDRPGPVEPVEDGEHGGQAGAVPSGAVRAAAAGRRGRSSASRSRPRKSSSGRGPRRRRCRGDRPSPRPAAPHHGVRRAAPGRRGGRPAHPGHGPDTPRGICDHADHQPDPDRHHHPVAGGAQQRTTGLHVRQRLGGPPGVSRQQHRKRHAVGLQQT